MVLAEFTWAQFSYATLFLTLLWYAVVCLCFYRKEIKALFHHKSAPASALVSTRMTTPPGREETYADDFLSKAEVLIQAFEKEGGSREDLLNSLQTLEKSYPGITSRGSIARRLMARCPFSLSPTQLKQLFKHP